MLKCQKDSSGGQKEVTSEVWTGEEHFCKTGLEAGSCTLMSLHQSSKKMVPRSIVPWHADYFELKRRGTKHISDPFLSLLAFCLPFLHDLTPFVQSEFLCHCPAFMKPNHKNE